ncbi:SCF ubiquitin ligase complex subunit cdc4, partial [Coemansia erecta]
MLEPGMYPLASVAAPAALERFAINMNEQNLYFAQRNLGANQSGEDILASIVANTSDTPMLESVVSHGYGHDSQLQRAMTPLYTQDDQQPNTYLESFEYPDNNSSSRRPTGRVGINTSDRRSSSPQSPSAQHGHFKRACSPSPRIARAVSPEPVEAAGGAGSDGASLEEEAGEGVHALPLPSPLLSPRARPEHMDTDETVVSMLPDGGALAHGSSRQLRFEADTDMARELRFDGEAGMRFDAEADMRFGAEADTRFGAETDMQFDSEQFDADMTRQQDGMFRHTRTRTEHEVTRQQMSKDMAAVYSMPDLMSTYDNLPPTMQTYLLFELLRRTPRPALQFAAQTVAPVLHRDFVGELPPEVAHHVLKFMGTRELSRAACVSRAWQRVVDGDRAVWRARLIDAR